MGAAAGGEADDVRDVDRAEQLRHRRAPHAQRRGLVWFDKAYDISGGAAAREAGVGSCSIAETQLVCACNAILFTPRDFGDSLHTSYLF